MAWQGNKFSELGVMYGKLLGKYEDIVLERRTLSTRRPKTLAGLQAQMATLNFLTYALDRLMSFDQPNQRK